MRIAIKLYIFPELPHLNIYLFTKKVGRNPIIDCAHIESISTC